MTITFENENDVIVYALAMVIDYARRTQYIIVVQSVWRIASVIGLTDGLATHIDNLHIRSKAYQTPVREIEQLPLEKKVATTPRDLQEDFGINNETSNSQLDRAEQVIRDTEEFLYISKRQRKEFKKKSDPLTRTRLGNILVKPLTTKRRNRLQAIPKDTPVEFLKQKK